MGGFHSVFTKKINKELNRIKDMLEEATLENLSKIQKKEVKEINLWGMKSSFLKFLEGRMKEKDGRDS